MITDYFTNQFTVYRMEDTSGVGEPWKQELAEGNSFYGHKQRIVAELSENLGISFTKGFTIWCPIDTDVYEGDTLKEGTDYYSVKAINKRDYGNNQHLEVVAEQSTEYGTI